MNKTVLFRDFEERDIDFIYRCKNDDKLNSMIVGEWHPFSHEEARAWVMGCIGEHDSFKFWAICTNDDEKRIVGWASLSNIDRVNKSACLHGIVIADIDYNDGFAWLETHLFLMEYAFDRLQLNRLYGMYISEHEISNKGGKVFLWKDEGVLKQAICKNNKYYDLVVNAILRDEYYHLKNSGEYDLKAILCRIRRIMK